MALLDIPDYGTGSSLGTILVLSLCSVDLCARPVHGRGYCSGHYQRVLKRGDPGDAVFMDTRPVSHECEVSGCGKRRHSRGLCSMHYWRLRKFGSTDLPKREPAEFVTTHGYVMVSDSSHPNANSSGNVFKHRLIMSRFIGRPLLPHESVHHINGDRLDNRIENLELWSKSQPAGQRVEDKVAWAVDLVKLYRPSLLA